jgi:hypothetical protein
MVQKLTFLPQHHPSLASHSPCEHRTVSKDGRIVCAKIVEGETSVSRELCRNCPFKAVNCSHLRFALQQITPSPLTVRYNGRVEVWDDDPPKILFEQAACLAKVAPIENPRACIGCVLRRPIDAPVERPRRRVAGTGKVVPFPEAGVVIATG